MGLINFYTARKLFSGDPKNLTQLRDEQQTKLNVFKEKGTFSFTMSAAGDKQPVMVISWTGEADEKGYWKSLVKPQKSIKGSFVADKKKKTYDLTADDSSKAVLAEYMKDPMFSVSLWNLIGEDLNALTVNGKALMQRSLGDQVWEIAQWDVARSLFLNNTLFDKAPLKGEQDDDSKEWVLANGLTLPEKLMVSVNIAGKMVAKAKDNEHTAAFLRDQVAEVFKPLVQALANDLKTIDAELPNDKDPKKAKSVKKANDRLDKFRSDAETAIVKSVTDQWLRQLEANVDYRDFKVDTAITIGKGVISLTLGITTAAVGGITGVGAVLGLVGTIKGGIETAVAAYQAFRNVEKMGKDLTKVLAVAIESQAATGWKNFGKEVLGKVPGGPALKEVLALGGVSVKSASDIEKELKTYNGKVSGLLVNAKDLGKKVADVVSKSDATLKALDSKEVKEAEASNPALKKSNEKKRKAIAEATTKFLDEIGTLTQRFETGKKSVDECGQLLDILKGKVKEDKVAGVLTKYFVPLLELPWGVDPTNVRASIQSAGSIGMDLASTALTDLASMGDVGEQAKDWMKFANDSINAIKGLQEIVADKKK